MAIKLHASCARDADEGREDNEQSNVVLLHGLFGSASNLGALARDLQPAFSVCSLDLPNHGRSEWLQAPDLASMADCVAAWMDTQGLPNAHLVGHSLGGKVAMELALAQPQRVISLIVADIAPVTYHGRHDAVFAALEAVAAADCRSRQAANAVMAAHVEDAGVIQFLSKSLQSDEQGIMRWRLDVQGLRLAYPQLIAAPASQRRYEGPVLFIKGADSDYIRPAHWPDIQALFPAASIKVMADCGHWLHAQKPALFNSIVSRFLRTHAESGDNKD